MRLRTVSYRRGATLNIGDYENVRVEVSADADPDEGETFDGVLKGLKAIVDDAVKTEVAAVRTKVARRAPG